MTTGEIATLRGKKKKSRKKGAGALTIPSCEELSKKIRSSRARRVDRGPTVKKRIVGSRGSPQRREPDQQTGTSLVRRLYLSFLRRDLSLREGGQS